MKIDLFDGNMYRISQWANGKSTELLIYPKEGDYLTGKFLWRVSVASFESNPSTFSVLHGVKRWIMPFDHEMHLAHAQNGNTLYSISLKPMETHCFKGDWSTEAHGQGWDFNLMLKDGANGMIKALTLTGDLILGEAFKEAFDGRFPVDEQNVTIGLYSKDFCFTITDDQQSGGKADIYRCQAGQLFVVNFSLKDFDFVRALKIAGNDQESRIAMFVSVYTDNK